MLTIHICQVISQIQTHLVSYLQLINMNFAIKRYDIKMGSINKFYIHFYSDENYCELTESHSSVSDCVNCQKLSSELNDVSTFLCFELHIMLAYLQNGTKQEHLR